MEVTIGGNRVGSGKKMKTSLNNYERSTHNLNKKFASSLAPGVLYPCYKKLVMRGDSIEIDINADVRTIPTKGPLFGTYKMQIDFFLCPIRLYVGLLHNNPIELGMQMDNVMLPIMKVSDKRDWSADQMKAAFSNSCLWKYLGMSGLGVSAALSTNTVSRELNAVPLLAYYDIFKNYYSNKQEENAWVITGDKHETSQIQGDHFYYKYAANDQYTEEDFTEMCDCDQSYIKCYWQYSETQQDQLHEDLIWQMPIKVSLYDGDTLTTWEDLKNNMSGFHYLEYNGNASGEGQIILIKEYNNSLYYKGKKIGGITAIQPSGMYEAEDKMKIVPFDLSNIDKMRYRLLSQHTLGTAYDITNNNETKLLPYSVNSTQCTNEETKNILPMNGLVLKTYQNDLFNNWLNADWIEGNGSIADLTKVSVNNGAFSLDAFSFAKKLYNMLNRVAASGGTSDDYQDAVYEESFRKHIETPMWIGGMSQEIVFDEVVQTAPADGDPLGTLGGRGRAAGNIKGGKLNVKVDEWGYIIGIVSLTPRIFYTQGNDFDLTEIRSINDIHKPALDGIGYQDLYGERMLWADTQIQSNSATIYRRSQIGKVPAWIEYMTDYDQAYGDFAETEGRGYMILNRNYEWDETTGFIKDATTYIDPAKYNYAFADAELTAQNFWCEIAFDVKARRLMSARIIPNV